MRRSQTKKLGSLLACLAAVALTTALAGTVHALEVGVGLSEAKDARAAGADAAAEAKAALGEVAPKLVLVFNCMDLKGPDQIGEMLAGVGSVFDASIVYGCTGYAPLTHCASGGTVGLLALAGDVEITTAVAAVEGEDGHQACGVGYHISACAVVEK